MGLAGPPFDLRDPPRNGDGNRSCCAEIAPLRYRPVEDWSSLLAYNPLLVERTSARLDAAYGRARGPIRRNDEASRLRR